MRIERIDENTVKCFVSNEELKKNNLDYQDFLTQTDKAKQLVKQIMRRAEEEVGYKPPQIAFDMQIMVLPDCGLVLTLSEKGPAFEKGNPIADCISDLKKMFEKFKADSAKPVSAEQQTEEKQPILPEGKPETALIVFDSLAKVMDYAEIMPPLLRVDSSLYKKDEMFYLLISKGRAAYDRFSRACIQALEFGALYAADESRIMAIKEHAELLIPEKAIRLLGKKSK